MFAGDVPWVRLDGGSRHFRRRWGYDATGAGCGAPASLLEDIDEDADDYYSDTYSLKSEIFLRGDPQPPTPPQPQQPPAGAAQGRIRFRFK